MAQSCNAGRSADNAAVTENKKAGKIKKPDSRSERLAAELRENLRRRKAQERAREAPGTRNDPKPPDSAPPGERSP